MPPVAVPVPVVDPPVVVPEEPVVSPVVVPDDPVVPVLSPVVVPDTSHSGSATKPARTHVHRKAWHGGG